MKTFTLWLLATGLSIAGCGGASGIGQSAETRTAVDENARVKYELTGAHLRVEVLPDAPRFEDLFLGRGAYTFGCGTDPYGRISEPDAEGTASFSPETRTAEVELSADISADVILCTAQGPSGAVESSAWFVSPEDLYGIDIPSEEEQRANEARAKNATDCVAFIKEVYEEYGVGRAESILPPGAPPTVPIKAYWFGPQLAERRATYAQSSMQVDFDEKEKREKVPWYTTHYQLPEDGCQSSALQFSSDEDFGFGAGHEIELINMPADSPTAQLYLRDREVLAGSETLQTRLANGEPVTVYVNAPTGFTVLTESTLLMIPERYSGEEAVQRLVPLLQPIGG